MCQYFSIMLYILLSLSISFTHGENDKVFYQDLTEIIDNSLKEGNTATYYRTALELALRKSTYIYYSTELLLNDISQLKPVINIIQQAKPRSAPYFLMLSLRFTSNNQFLWKRLDDIYYNLSPDVDPELKQFFKQHLTSIVLDWRVESCDEPALFFGRVDTITHLGYGFEFKSTASVPTTHNTAPNISYSFPKYTKNFISMICEENGICSKISVGMAYNINQVGCASYLLNQIKDADFLLIPVIFSSHREFPFSYPLFFLYMNTFEYQNENWIERKWNKKIVYQVNIRDPPSVSQVKSECKKEWNDLEGLLSSSKFYEEAVQEIVTETHNKAVNLLESFIFQYTLYTKLKGNASTDNNNDTISSIVLGRSMILKSGSTTSKQFIIPHLYTTEVDATPCSLKMALATAGSGTLFVDAQTWRAMARYKKKIGDSLTNCSEENVSFGRKTDVLLLLDPNTINAWNHIEKYVTQLLKETKTVGSTTLQTVIFPENGITDLMHPFIKSIFRNYSLGCTVDFTPEKLEILTLRLIFSNEIKFEQVMREFCASIFDRVRTMIWNIDKLNVESGKELIVVARQVFMKEFPTKAVIIQLSPNSPYSGDYVGSWSEYYDTPVAV